MKEALKNKVAEVISDAMIKQAEMGMKHTWLPGWSEPTVPAKLLEEDVE